MQNQMQMLKAITVFISYMLLPTLFYDIRVEAFSPPAPPVSKSCDTLQTLQMSGFTDIEVSRRSILSKSSLLLPLLAPKAALANDNNCMTKCLKNCKTQGIFVSLS